MKFNTSDIYLQNNSVIVFYSCNIFCTVTGFLKVFCI